MASPGRFPIRQGFFVLFALGALGSSVGCNSTSSTSPGPIETSVPTIAPIQTPTPISSPSPGGGSLEVGLALDDRVGDADRVADSCPHIFHADAEPGPDLVGDHHHPVEAEATALNGCTKWLRQEPAGS